MRFSEYLLQLVIVSHLFVIGIFKPSYAQRGKRLLFLTTLANELINKGKLDNNINNINKKLSLADNPDALLIGRHISKQIWSNSDLDNKVCICDDCVSIKTIEEVSDKIIASAPKWIKYDLQMMRGDICTLLVCR